MSVITTAKASNGAIISHAVGVSRATSWLVLMKEKVVVVTLII
jgi:hypothetical protein